MQSTQKRFRAFCLGIVGGLVGTQAGAEQGLSYFPPVDSHLVPSKYVKQTFKIQVMQPAGKRGETTRFPVVYVTDANLVFDMFKGISHLIQSPEKEGSRYILVGIGYPSESPLAGSALRARDLTFPGYPKLKIKPPTYEDVPVPEPGTKTFYGAEDFQKFIEHELIPFIDKTYHTVPGERTYFGHSAGGGFGLYTLFAKTHLFKNYIVSSPGLIYHGQGPAEFPYENYDFVLQEARKFIASKKPLHGTSLYMSVGTAEEFEPGLDVWSLTSSFYRMAALMKGAAIPGLEFTTEVFPGETHGTVWPIAFMHGVQAVLGTGVAK
jgi:uncharacterized protein